jgi:GntR family transcriptional regulator / MocR family aminotransferase
VRIPVDRESTTPLFRQIELWLRSNIESGSLPNATRLPSTRSLASELGVSRITVVNAYAALEGDGLLVSREGGGTYVAAPDRIPTADADEQGRDWPLWQRELSAATMARTELIPDHTAHPDPISFTGVGDPRVFALSEFGTTIKEVLRQDGTDALEYGPFDRGYPPLRETVAQILASQGIQTHPRQVLITAGSQQALALTCQVLLQREDCVLVEQPTYNFALDLFRDLHLRIVGVPVDESGMQVERVEALLQQHHPRLIYTIPNFQNPSGACLSGIRRRQLLELSDRYNVPIVEDDFAGDLRYEGRSQPAIKALDRAGHVIYVGTFSKLLAPGLRVGYAVADGPVLERLTHHKRVHDLTTSPLMQRVLDRHVTLGRYQAHLRRTTRLYRRRRDSMLTALGELVPDAVASPPHGGLFVWVALPEPVSARALLTFALEEGVEFAPGDQFFTDPADGDRFVRLNFATQSPDDITRGIRRLATALERAKRHLARVAG